MVLKKFICGNMVVKLNQPITEKFDSGEKRVYKYGVILSYKAAKEYSDYDCDIYCETYKAALTKAHSWGIR